MANQYGTFAQSDDGTDATSPLLWDGQVLHTPGEYSEDNAGTNLYSEPDALGSSAGVLSSGGGTDATYEYDAFGNVLGGSGSLPVSYPFDQGFGAGAGYTEEAGTGGLVRCGNRYYNPYFGRFLTQDSSGDGLNWYAYCDNDPTDALDPSGLAPQGGSDPYGPVPPDLAAQGVTQADWDSEHHGASSGTPPPPQPAPTTAPSTFSRFEANVAANPVVRWLTNDGAGYDFRVFNRTDLHAIGNGMQRFGQGEMAIANGTAFGAVAGGYNPKTYMPLPLKKPITGVPTNIPFKWDRSMTPLPKVQSVPATQVRVGGLFAAVTGGLGIGGLVSKGLGSALSYLTR